MDSNRYRHARPEQPRQAIDGFVQSPKQTLAANRNPVRGDYVRYERQPAPRMMFQTAQPSSPQQATPSPVLVTPTPVTAQAQALPTEPRLPAFNMELPDSTADEPRQPKLYFQRRRTTQKWAIRMVAALLVVMLGGGGILFAQGYFKVAKVFKGGASAAAIQKNVDPVLLKGEGDGRVNVLLLGRGGDGHEAPDLTDTIMVASIDPVNKSAILLSLPRDTYVNVPHYGKMKLNAAYESGKYRYLHRQDADSTDPKAIQAGFDVVDNEVSDITGLTIHYNTLVDFHAFKQAVDTVNGVTVNVPEDLYDPTMAWENKHNPVLAKAGIQNFDGKQALLYVRSRETSSDFARSERQRSVILAIKNKVVSLGTLSNPFKISQLMSAFSDNVQTDISLGDASRMYSIMKGIDNGKITSIGLTDSSINLLTTGMINGQSYVMPRAGLFDFAAIKSYVREHFRDGYIVKENAKVTVLNGTFHVGLAQTKADELKTYGYNVTTVGNAPTDSYNHTIILDRTNGAKKYTKNYLEKRFGVKAVTSLPAGSNVQPGDADFVIIVANDETTGIQT